MDAETRVAYYQELFAAIHESNRTWAKFLEPDLARARYYLGSSLSDRVLPYLLDSDLREVFRDSLIELAYLYTGRNRLILGEEAYDVFLLGAREAPVTLRPPAYEPPEGLQNQTMRRAMALAPRILPGLDSGVLASWWGTGGKGRSLLASWTSLMAKAIEEMCASHGREQTPYLVQWVVLDLFQDTGSFLDEYKLDETVRLEVQVAQLLALYLSQHIVRSQLLANSTTLAGMTDEIQVLIHAVINPQIAFLHAPNLLDLCRFYPVSVDILGPRRQTLIGTIGKMGIRKAQAALKGWFGNKDVVQGATTALLCDWLNEQFIQILNAGVSEGGEIWNLCHTHLRSNKILAASLDDKNARKETLDLIQSANPEPQAHDQVARLASFLENYNPKVPLQGILEERQVYERSAPSMLAEAGDSVTARAANEILKRFYRRSEAEAGENLSEEYEAGRIYRFGLGVESFLKKYEPSAKVGHYFIDLKDHVGRAALLAEESANQFLQRELYQPILNIAYGLHQGGPQVGDRGGLQLNSVLSDAVTFSGDIVALVHLARSTRVLLDSYTESLSEALDEDMLQVRIQVIEEQFAEAKKNLGLVSVETAAAHNRLDADRREILDRLTGKRLLAGSFIAFGPTPSMVKVDVPVWGKVQVSVGDKINEAARGTARTESVIRSMRAILDLQRRKRKQPNLELPFRVYVSNTLGLLPLEPEVELGLRRAFVHGNRQRALELYQTAALEQVQNTVAAGPRAVQSYITRGMAIYNTGDALSGEALQAYREAREGQMHYEERTVEVTELEPDIWERFAFIGRELRLVVGQAAVEREREVFRYAGSVVFPGFEGSRSIEVWEMLNLDDLGAQMISQSKVVHGKQ